MLLVAWLPVVIGGLAPCRHWRLGSLSLLVARFHCHHWRLGSVVIGGLAPSSLLAWLPVVVGGSTSSLAAQLPIVVGGSAPRCCWWLGSFIIGWWLGLAPSSLLDWLPLGVQLLIIVGGLTPNHDWQLPAWLEEKGTRNNSKRKNNKN